MRTMFSAAARAFVNQMLDEEMADVERVAASLPPRDPFGFYRPCGASPSGSHEMTDTNAGVVCVHCWRVFG